MKRRRAVVVVLGCAAAAVILAAALEWKEFAAAWYIRKLDSADPEARAHAATRLGELGSVRAVPGLLRLIEEAKVEAVRETVWVDQDGLYNIDGLIVLYVWGTDDSLLRSAWDVDDIDRFARSIAADIEPRMERARVNYGENFVTMHWNASKASHARIREALAGLLEVKQVMVSRSPDLLAVRNALQRIGPPALPCLEACMEDPSETIRERAIALLAISDIEWKNKS
jgi:hypothetical protein